MNADFEGIEVHSRTVFNTVKEKTTATKQADESVGPMVSSKIAEFFSVHRQISLKTKLKRTKSHLDFSVLFCFVFCFSNTAVSICHYHYHCHLHRRRHHHHHPHSLGPPPPQTNFFPHHSITIIICRSWTPIPVPLLC